jgi:chromate transporter
MIAASEPAETTRHPGSPREVLRVFLRLGLTSLGGPIAHLGYDRSEFVARRKWLDEASFADIVALCQFLPGPASSQVAISIGMLRAGLAGDAAEARTHERDDARPVAHPVEKRPREPDRRDRIG